MNRALTKKQLYRQSAAVYYVGYCDLYDLLMSFDRIGYNAGLYGWNWNAYQISMYCINTGYRNLTGKRIPHDLAEKYNRLGFLAQKKYSHYQSKRLCKELIYRLIRETERR